MATTSKAATQRLLETMPDEFEWDEFARLIHERMQVEQGIREAAEGRVTSNEEIRRRYGLPA